MFKKIIFVLLVGFFFLSWIEARAEEPKNKIDYLCTGIGETKLDPKNNQYPAKIIFASNSRALYTDITVSVNKDDGAFVTKIFCDAAWLLMKLEPGKYDIQGVDQKGLSRKCTLTVKPSGISQCLLTWPD